MRFSFNRTVRTLAMAGVATTMIGGTAYAAGFQLKEQSATAQGNAFAGATAGADDISYMYFNPAALSRHNKRAQTHLSVSYIAPESELKESSATSTNAAFGNVTGQSTQDDVGPNAAVPAFYASLPFNRDFVAGIGVNTPLGLETDYDDDWVGRYEATDSEVLTVNINPALSWQATDWLAIGAGAQIEYIDVELENRINFGALGAALNAFNPFLAPGSIPHAQDGSIRAEGDSWGAGFNVGILAQPTERIRVGLGYRSQIKHELEGQGTFDLGGPTGQAVAAIGSFGTFQNSGLTAGFTSPDTFSAGVHVDLNDQWAVLGEFQYTYWEKFKELTIAFDNPASVPGGRTTVREEWNNNRFFALGTTYKHDEALTLRAGLALDETPIPDAFRTARIPGGDRYWASLGASYKLNEAFGFSAGYTFIQVEDTSINQGPAELGVGDSLTAEYESNIQIFTLAAIYRF